ncbi:unnamed protein product [Clavelina lepadiformis]|uniref:Uncharacterized protein n=1 Tax=Clavelina lepadiformis TaxID=159417 RepID=A0ABP0G321_CLALP
MSRKSIKAGKGPRWKVTTWKQPEGFYEAINLLKDRMESRRLVRSLGCSRMFRSDTVDALKILKNEQLRQMGENFVDKVLGESCASSFLRRAFLRHISDDDFTEVLKFSARNCIFGLRCPANA